MRVLLTRPEDQIEPLKTELERLGFTVLVQPTIEIRPLADAAEIAQVDAAAEDLANGKFDWLVFASPNGVRFFVDRLHELKYQIPGEVRLAAIGPGTGKALREWTGRPADVLPEIFTAEGVAEKLHSEAVQGKRFLILRADRGRKVLAQEIEQSGGDVTEVAVYRNVDIDQADAEIGSALEAGRIDWIAVTSSAIGTSLVRLFGDSLRKTKLLSIGPITSETLKSLGFPPAVEASPSSLEGIVDTLKMFSRAAQTPVDFSQKIMKKEISLSDFQNLIREMYYEKDAKRGPEATFLWLMEEVGELAGAVRSGSKEEREGEFADVLAWVTTIANILDIDLTEAIAKKYGDGCPGCGRYACECPDSEKP